MIARGDGAALLAIGSLAGVRGDPGIAAYCASKAGLGGLVRSLAVELAEHRIRCNALLPGFTVNSSFSPEAMGSQRGRAIDAAIPAGRWRTAEDIAHAAGTSCTVCSRLSSSDPRDMAGHGRRCLWHLPRRQLGSEQGRAGFKQHLDRATLVHRGVSVRDVL
jgi:NAD(P)-dependent dehydrogenase (short-subunit alcohol dehydrogenase family)